MMNVVKWIARVTKDEEGAALLEYTVLLGILVIAVIGTITLVGGWINGQWASLNGALPEQIVAYTSYAPEGKPVRRPGAESHGWRGV
jgi:pilus assembly protein Flp/PilA